MLMVFGSDFIFVGASAVLGISIALGVLTNNSRCALDYFVTACCIAWILASIKTVARLAPLSIVGAASIGTSRECQSQHRIVLTIMLTAGY